MMRSGKDRVFCAGANIRMLGGARPRAQGELLQVHQRDAHRDRGRDANIRASIYICRDQRHRRRRRLRAGAGRDHIMLVDDGSTAVSLPELPLLAVLPGTGGLTRV